MADKFKFTLALLLLVAGLAGFYLFAEQATPIRVVTFLAGAGLSAAVAWQTELGRQFFVFFKEAVLETKKVVWPTRKETLQTTIMVCIFAVVMALFLWVTDRGLEWLLYDQLLGWKKL